MDIPQIITDNFIMNLFYGKNSYPNRNYISKCWQDKHLSIKDYLTSRYKDSSSVLETLFRIKNHVEDRPTCQLCGGPTKFLGSHGFQTYCSRTCLNKSPEHINKVKQTCIDHFGGPGAQSSAIVRQKTVQTWQDHFGADNPYHCKEIREKIKRIDIETYGVPYHIAAKSVIEKADKTREDRYGDPHFINREKIKETIRNKYGVDCATSSKEIQKKIKASYEENHSIDKIFETRKKNRTLNSSSIEQLFKAYLEDQFKNDYRFSYKSNLYPYHCDFYIISLDLYVEIQGFWTHGKHPFSSNDQNDLAILEIWKGKKTKFYDNAIKTWTIRDVKKRTIAKENGLSYLEIFSNDIDICIQKFEEKCREIKNHA